VDERLGVRGPVAEPESGAARDNQRGNHAPRHPARQARNFE